jgi:hypothetical protein
MILNKIRCFLDCMQRKEKWRKDLLGHSNDEITRERDACIIAYSSLTTICLVWILEGKERTNIEYKRERKKTGLFIAMVTL